MKEGLKTGDTVEMRDFGVLRVRTRGHQKGQKPENWRKGFGRGKESSVF